MRQEYDFSQSIPNPYAKKLRKQITTQRDEKSRQYFADLSESLEISKPD